MEKTIKFKHLQTFSDQDYLIIKHALKGKKKDNNDYKQIPSAFFMILSSMAFISYLNKDSGSMILSIVGAIICMLGVFFVNFIDSNGVMVYKILFAKSVMKEIIFYADFMECHNEMEMQIILYDNVYKIYEHKEMLFVRLKGKEKKYLFLSKKGMDHALYDYLKQQFLKQWKNIDEQSDFHL